MTAWENWPGELGAPYYDLNHNGQWDAGIDEPGIANADQVIWFVVNDLDAQKTSALYGSVPIGLEIQITIWDYNETGQVGDMSFLRRRFTNKSGVHLDSTFIGLWSDTDLGRYSDDFAGCDTLHDLIYTYNGFSSDVDFAEFNIPPPAFGYTLLQGPVVPVIGETAFFDMHKIADYGNLDMTSTWIHASGGAIPDPDLHLMAIYGGLVQVRIRGNGPSSG
jgi:hypothetical protein